MIYTCPTSSYDLFFNETTNFLTTNVNEKKQSNEDINADKSNDEFDEIDEMTKSAAVNGNLFTDFKFYVHFSIENKNLKEITHSIKTQNGEVLMELNDQVTHVVVDKM